MKKIINRYRKGFTLIELLVVIAIIGILAALIIVSLTGAQGKARDTQRKNNARNLNSAQEQFFADNSSYLVDMIATAVTPTAVSTSGSCTTNGALYGDGTAGKTLFGTSGYVTNTNVCADPTSGATNYAWYNTATTTTTQGTGATTYVLGWKLSAQSEAATTAGNGVYKSASTGNTFSAVAAWPSGNQTVTSATLVTNDTNYFVVFGPQ